MAFCIQDCVDFDDSFTDSDCEYEDDVWSDDESISSAPQLNVGLQDSKFNPVHHPQMGVKDVFALINSDTHKPMYASPMNFCRIFFGECQVCIRKVGVVCRPCCKFVLCKTCFQMYIAEKVQLGMTEIECPNTCSYRIDPRDIIDILPFKYKQKYRLLQIAEMRPPFSKACYCGNSKFFKDDISDNERTKIICSRCELALCISCFMPWHQGVSCRQNQKGDKLLKSWAKGFLPGQPKAQKCPKCKIYIERITGCDHMTCTKCGTKFCYRCGEAFRSWKAFGDHSSKLSVFGCKYAFLPNKPFCRKLIRGSLFSTRVFAAVTIGTLAIGVGSAAVCVGAAALPFYGAVRMYRKLKRKRQSSIPESVGPASSPPNCYLIRKIPNISDETEQKRKCLKNPDLTSPKSQTPDRDSTHNSTIKDVSDWLIKNKKNPQLSHPDEETEEMAADEEPEHKSESESALKTELDLSQD